jgi:hypothetical protein
MMLFLMKGTLNKMYTPEQTKLIEDHTKYLFIFEEALEIFNRLHLAKGQRAPVFTCDCLAFNTCASNKMTTECKDLWQELNNKRFWWNSGLYTKATFDTNANKARKDSFESIIEIMKRKQNDNI